MQIFHRKKANLLSEISVVEQLKGWSEGTETTVNNLSKNTFKLRITGYCTVIIEMSTGVVCSGFWETLVSVCWELCTG